MCLEKWFVESLVHHMQLAGKHWFQCRGVQPLQPQARVSGVMPRSMPHNTFNEFHLAAGQTLLLVCLLAWPHALLMQLQHKQDMIYRESCSCRSHRHRRRCRIS